MSKASVVVLALSVVSVIVPFHSGPPQGPRGPIFGDSYVVTDVQTLQGLTVDAVVPAGYVVGTYVSGGDTARHGISDPCPLGSYRFDSQPPGGAASAIDYRWIHQHGSLAKVVWDLGSPRGAVVVFPSIDHGPFPEEGIEYTVWGSNDPALPFPDGWTLGTLSAIYTRGWTDHPNCTGVESDDWAGEYTFGFLSFRYVAAWASRSITIFLDPSHTTWSSQIDDGAYPGWQSDDEEIDGVGAPVCSPGTPTADAGTDQVVPVGTVVQFDGTASTGNVSLYGWDTDGDSVIDLTGSRPTKLFAAPFEGTITLTVLDNHGCNDADSLHVSVVANRAPTVSSFTATGALEGDAVTFSAIAADPDGDPLTYAFDFESDGTWDANGTATTASRVFGDDFSGLARVRVSDGRLAVDATVAFTVGNVAPSLIGALSARATADVTLRVAGEKWHDVSLAVVEGTATVAAMSVVRTPGSPDAQAATLEDVTFDALSSEGGFVVTYTPEDDPVNGRPNGATPVWIVLTAPDGREVRLHHTFNVRHPDTWVWRVGDVRVLLAGFPVTFTASGSDPGSDDLVFAWSWGDGSPDTTVTVYNDGAGPDPYPSPEVNPIAAMTSATHAFAAGTYTVTLTLRDDDGGTSSSSVVLRVG